MKNLYFLMLITLMSCSDNITPCSPIGSQKDTLIVGSYKLFLISLIDKDGKGSLEVVDKNNNNINASNNFSFNLVQLQNGSNCWEFTKVSKATGISSNSYDGTYSGAPSWAINSTTKAIIKLTISGNQYFLVDKNVNK